MNECSAGRLAGPFTDPPFDDLRISPIGLVPKKESGKFRLIHHLSYPEGKSVNDGIPREFCSVSYNTIDDAVRMVRCAGRGCHLAKTDIENAFRIVPVHPDDHHLLGLKWKNKIYYDMVLPFGASPSCSIFEDLSTSLQWAARHKISIQYIIHILDDFMIACLSKVECDRQLNLFIEALQEVGIPISIKKTFFGAQVQIFMGIEIDTIKFELRLPEDKLQKCRRQLNDAIGRDKITLRELQALLGLLSFSCSVITPGRPFLRRMFDLTIRVSKPFHRIRLTREAKKDMTQWLRFLDKYNGKSLFFSDYWLSSKSLHLYTDSAAGFGFGAILDKKWAYGRWPRHLKGDKNISLLELYPIVLAVRLWRQQLANQAITFHTDNQALVPIINAQTSLDKRIMILVRILVLDCLKYNIRFRAVHIEGRLNVLADLLSRLKLYQFQKIANHLKMEKEATKIPLAWRPAAWLPQ